MKFKILFLGFSFLLLSACRSGAEKKELNNISTLETPDIEITEFKLLGDTLPYDALWPTDILAVDTFMLVAQHKDKDLIHVYSLKDTTKLGSFLHKGGGPNEVNNWNGFVQSWIEGGEIKVLVQSYPQFIAVLNLNKSLNMGSAVFDEKYSFNTDSAKAIMIRSNAVYKIGDRFLMNRAPDRIANLTNYNPSFQWFDYSKNECGDIIYAMDQPIYPSPLLYMSGGVAYNSNNGKLCYSCRFMNLFFVLDVKTGQSVQIIPNNERTNINKVINDRDGLSYSQDLSFTDKYIYIATYNGMTRTEQKENGIRIEVYDWDGNHICRFLLPDSIYYLAVKPDNSMLYVVLPDGGMKSYRLPDFE